MTIETTQPKPDFLAILTAMGGGSYCRASTPEAAAVGVIDVFKRDWKGVAEIKPDAELTIPVFDVTGRDNVSWDDHGFYDAGTNDKFEPTRTTIIVNV